MTILFLRSIKARSDFIKRNTKKRNNLFFLFEEGPFQNQERERLWKTKCAQKHHSSKRKKAKKRLKDHFEEQNRMPKLHWTIWNSWCENMRQNLILRNAIDGWPPGNTSYCRLFFLLHDWIALAVSQDEFCFVKRAWTSNCRHYRYIVTSHSCCVLNKNALLAFHSVCYVLFGDKRRSLKEENAMKSLNKTQTWEQWVLSSCLKKPKTYRRLWSTTPPQGKFSENDKWNRVLHFIL